MSNNSNGDFPLKTIKTLEREWSGIPNYILMFPVMIALSGAMSKEREATIGLGTDERADALVNFRTRLLGDVLTEAPKMVSITKLTEMLQAKQEQAGAKFDEENPKPEKNPELGLWTKARLEAKEAVRLTEEEVTSLYEPFPGWDEVTAEETGIKNKAVKFFSQKKAGREIYSLLVEAVITDYWTWATPRPTISVSVFTQSK